MCIAYATRVMTMYLKHLLANSRCSEKLLGRNRMVSTLWSFTKQNLSIRYSSEVTLNYAQRCLRLLLPSSKHFCDMVYSAPIQDEKTTVTLSFWVALVEREKKKDIQHSESVFISLRRRKRDQKIHLFNRRRSRSSK